MVNVKSAEKAFKAAAKALRKAIFEEERKKSRKVPKKKPRKVPKKKPRKVPKKKSRNKPKRIKGGDQSMDTAPLTFKQKLNRGFERIKDGTRHAMDIAEQLTSNTLTFSGISL